MPSMNALHAHQASSSPSSTRLAASSRRRSKRAAFGSWSGAVVIVCNSIQTLPRLWNNSSSRRVSSWLIPVVVPFVVADGSVGGWDVDAARTVDTSDEARALGVAGDGDDGFGSCRVCDAFLNPSNARGVSGRSSSVVVCLADRCPS